MIKWLIEISADNTWIEDGFNLSNPSCREAHIDNKILPYASSYEKKVRVVKHPDLKKVAKLQGYSSIKQMKEDYQPYLFRSAIKSLIRGKIAEQSINKIMNLEELEQLELSLTDFIIRLDDKKMPTMAHKAREVRQEVQEWIDEQKRVRHYNS